MTRLSATTPKASPAPLTPGSRGVAPQGPLAAQGVRLEMQLPRRQVAQDNFVPMGLGGAVGSTAAFLGVTAVSAMRAHPLASLATVGVGFMAGAWAGERTAEAILNTHIGRHPVAAAVGAAGAGTVAAGLAIAAGALGGGWALALGAAGVALSAGLGAQVLALGMDLPSLRIQRD